MAAQNEKPKKISKPHLFNYSLRPKIKKPTPKPSKSQTPKSKSNDGDKPQNPKK